MSARELKIEALAAQGLVEALRESGEDDAGVACGLDSETAFVDVARAVVRDVVESEANAAAAKEVAKTYRDRAGRLEARAQRGRGALLTALETVGLRRLQLPEATISAGRGRAGVTITDEELVPLVYRRADPRIETAYEQLLRAAAYAASNGHPEMQADFLGTAEALMALFTLDRVAIAKVLEAGEEVSGAVLGNQASWLVVRCG